MDDRKKEAEFLLAHPLIKGFFESEQKRAFELFCATPVSEDRELIYVNMLALQALKGRLAAYLFDSGDTDAG